MKGVKGILLMAGEGKRFGGPTPKQFQLQNGKPVYQWTLETFTSSGLFEEIILVCHPSYVDEVQKATSCLVVPGGETRQKSSYLGLLACETADIVCIHDAVRPFVSERILRENIENARLHGAVDTCIPSTDTIVYSQDGKTIDTIPNRSHYLRGQTPQTFSYSLILKSHQKTQKKDATDDCQLVLDLGSPVFIVLGDDENHKITTTQDLTTLKSQASLQALPQEPR